MLVKISCCRLVIRILLDGSPVIQSLHREEGNMTIHFAGYVRRTSSRLIPDLTRNGNHMTIGRPIALDEEEYEEYLRSLKNGKKK